VAPARKAHGDGEDRWAATLLNHVVFAEPSNGPAKELLASVYDQLGFRAEAGPWRDVYLTGAYELRHGIRGTGIEPARATGLLRNSPVERFLDSVAVRLTRELLIALGTEQAGLKDLVMSDDLTVEGSRLKLLSFLALIDTPDVRSPVVTP